MYVRWLMMIDDIRDDDVCLVLAGLRVAVAVGIVGWWLVVGAVVDRWYIVVVGLYLLMCVHRTSERVIERGLKIKSQYIISYSEKKKVYPVHFRYTE